MNIMPVLLNFKIPSISFKQNNQKHSSFGVSLMNKEPVQDVFVKQNKTIPSFGGIIKTSSEFRNLAAKRTMHCIYCNRPLLSNKALDKLKASGVFSKNIKDFVQVMFYFLDYIHPTEKNFLKKITIMAFDYPKIRLSEAIKKLYPEANKELLYEQMPILKELSSVADELPYGYKTKFKKLLRISKYRLLEKEYIPEEFSGKEFSYKIKRIEETIKDKTLAQKIIKLTEPLTHPIFKKPSMPLNSKFINKILNLTQTRDVDKSKLTKADLQLILISQIKKYAEILNRKDIINYCDTAVKTIEQKPVKIKFSNKAFKYDINEILDGMSDVELRKKIDTIIGKLPNSRTSVNAFITKHEMAASDAIGYDILRPSLATIEHMKAKSKGGLNELYNYALACERDNNMRSNGNMAVFIEQFPLQNQKNYFKEIFEEVKKGNITSMDARKMVDTFIEQSGRYIDIKSL